MRVVPAILANNLEDFKRFIKIAETFTDYVQLDFMDGLFVPSKSITPDELRDFRTTLRTEAHLMVKQPEDYLETLKEFGTEKVLFHFEAVSSSLDTLNTIKDKGFTAGLAINPETSLAEVEELTAQVDSVLFLTVNPGFYGSPFMPEVLDKVKELKKSKPHLSVGVDGGIKLDNIKMVKDAGADFVCVGSAIFVSSNPAQSFLDFQRAGGV